MMKVLVTGGAGFIGSHIVDRLLERGFEVAVIDNLSSGNKENLNAMASFYKANITDMGAVESAFRDEAPEYVVHAAANIKVRKSVENPIYDARINILGGLNVLDCCKIFNVKKIVYLCTGGALYGNPRYLPVDESHPIDPISPYGISKRALELYLSSYSGGYGLNFITLRLSNVYGPRDHPESGHAIPKFIASLLNNKSPAISGDGSQARDFIYVDDAADAVMSALAKSTKEKFFNIGAGKAVSINKLFREVKLLLKSDISPKYKEAKKGDVRKICLSIKKAEKEMGWVPKTSLAQGLAQTIKWFKER